MFVLYVMALHRLYDGSSVQLMNAKDLVKLKSWNGNRILDTIHVQKIKESVGEDVQRLDFGYRVVTFDEVDAGGTVVKVSQIIDGQHRHAVLCDYFNSNLFTDDFPVVVIVKHVQNETEAVDYFQACNNTKAITYSDPNLIVNEYIKHLEKVFNVKTVMIRKGNTTRPYLGVEKLRDALMAKVALLGSAKHAAGFAERVYAWNAKTVKNVEINSLGMTKEQDLYLRAGKIGFMLAFDTKMRWITECLV